jgi:transcriptional regulator with XRE-family HTH domain
MDIFQKQHILSLSPSQMLQHFGRRMKELRVSRRKTQKELAEITGVSEMTIVNLEHGKNVSMEVALLVIRALDELNLINRLCLEPIPESPLLALELQKKRMKNKRIRVRK